MNNYKVLVAGDQLRKDDEYYSFYRKEWLKVETWDRQIPEMFSGFYRRPLEDANAVKSQT